MQGAPPNLPLSAVTKVVAQTFSSLSADFSRMEEGGEAPLTQVVQKAPR
jgi:hypothetical protein